MNGYPLADMVIAVAAVGAAVCGLFIGFSGSLAFLVSSAVGIITGRCIWSESVRFSQSGWARALATLVIALLVFGIIRWSVRKIVNGLLSQPADSIFGMLVSALTVFLLAIAAVVAVNSLGFCDIESRFAETAVRLVYGG